MSIVQQCISLPQKNKDLLKPPLCISTERLAPTSCPSDNRLQGNSDANLEPDFSMGLYFCSSSRIRALGNQPAGAVRMLKTSTVGHFPFPSPFLVLILLPLVLILLVYIQMTSRARKKKGRLELCNRNNHASDPFYVLSLQRPRCQHHSILVLVCLQYGHFELLYPSMPPLRRALQAGRSKPFLI